LKFTNTVSAPPSPPNFTFWRGWQKKIFGANAPTSSPPNLGPSLRHQVYVATRLRVSGQKNSRRQRVCN